MQPLWQLILWADFTEHSTKQNMRGKPDEALVLKAELHELDWIKEGPCVTRHNLHSFSTPIPQNDATYGIILKLFSCSGTRVRKSVINNQGHCVGQSNFSKKVEKENKYIDRVQEQFWCLRLLVIWMNRNE